MTILLICQDIDGVSSWCSYTYLDMVENNRRPFFLKKKIIIEEHSDDLKSRDYVVPKEKQRLVQILCIFACFGPIYVANALHA